MKNVLNYYYELYPTDIHQINKKYKFNINEKNYILCELRRKPEEIEELYDLYKYIKSLNVQCHNIVLNKANNIITAINGIPHVLLIEKIKNKKIEMNDLQYLSNIPIINKKYINIQRDNWTKLWSDKIDYIEYQISQFGKEYKIIRESSDYYIGIVENCIQLLNECNTTNIYRTISHNRINDELTTEELYNPLNFIIDNRTRDISEYIKSKIEKKNIDIMNILNILENYIHTNRLNSDEINLMFIRILYPSSYLDKCEQIFKKNAKEKELLTIINNSTKYEQNVKKIYIYLKKLCYIPDIEWLLKTISY